MAGLRLRKHAPGQKTPSLLGSLNQHTPFGLASWLPHPQGAQSAARTYLLVFTPIFNLWLVKLNLLGLLPFCVLFGFSVWVGLASWMTGEV